MTQLLRSTVYKLLAIPALCCSPCLLYAQGLRLDLVFNGKEFVLTSGGNPISGALTSRSGQPINFKVSQVNTLVFDVNIKPETVVPYGDFGTFLDFPKAQADAIKKELSDAKTPVGPGEGADELKMAIGLFIEKYGIAYRKLSTTVVLQGDLKVAGAKSHVYAEVAQAKDSAVAKANSGSDSINARSYALLKSEGAAWLKEIEAKWDVVKVEYNKYMSATFDPNDAAVVKERTDFQNHFIVLLSAYTQYSESRKGFTDTIEKTAKMWELIEKADFVVPMKETLVPTSGYALIKVELSPKKDSPFGDPTKLTDHSYTVRIDIVGGVEMDVSTGFSFGKLIDERFTVVDVGGTPTARRVGNRDEFRPSPSVLLHVYRGSASSLATALSFGFSYGKDQDLQYLLGLSIMAKGTNRFVFTVGMLGGKTMRLDEGGALVVGQPAPMIGVFRTAWFLGVTYNIGK